jgi:hypothetical protein
MTRYDVSDVTLTRWCRETGLKPKRIAASVIAKPAGRWHTPAAAVTVDTSTAAQAAQHLRRRGFSNIFKSEILSTGERGRWGIDGDGKGIWIVAGRGAVPAADLIALASAKGFDPQAWARI